MYLFRPLHIAHLLRRLYRTVLRWVRRPRCRWRRVIRGAAFASGVIGAMTGSYELAKILGILDREKVEVEGLEQYSRDVQQLQQRLSDLYANRQRESAPLAQEATVQPAIPALKPQVQPTRQVFRPSRPQEAQNLRGRSRDAARPRAIPLLDPPQLARVNDGRAVYEKTARTSLGSDGGTGSGGAGGGGSRAGQTSPADVSQDVD